MVSLIPATSTHAKIMSKTLITSILGSIGGDLSDTNNIFREVRKTMIQNFFSKEWAEHRKPVQSYKEEQEKNKALQEAYGQLLVENKILGSAENNKAAQKCEKSEKTN